MPKIEHSTEILASKDRVWDIISDLDNEGEYWYGTKDVRNISREGDTINREITQNFRNHRILQKVILHPKDSIEIHYLKGLTQGLKTLSIETIGENTQKLKAFWNVRFPGIYWIMSPFISSHIEKGTVNALQRIKNVCEGRPVTQEISKD